MLMLGHAGVQAPRRDSRYRMFHVKRPMASVATKCLHFGMTERRRRRR